LHTGFQRVVHNPIERGHLNGSTESRLTNGDRYLTNQMVPFPFEDRMLANVDLANEIAARRPRRSCLALTAHRQLQAAEASRRYRNRQRSLDGNSCRPLAMRTRVGNDNAAAAAAPTRLLNPEEALVGQHHAMTPAMPALGRTGPLAAAAAPAFGAVLRPR